MTATVNGQDDDLNKKILKQIEYYFGNVNLQRDKFLQDEIKKEHGWVPLDVLLTFNRLKQLTTDKKVIAEALKTSDVVDVSEDGEKVRRNPDVPIPENTLEFWNEIKTRTVYVKGFEPDTKLDDILSYLKPYGTVQNVVMRRLKDTKAFKGSVFATFATTEEAQKVVESEDAKTFNEKEMTRMMQKDYWAKSIAESKEKKAAKKALIQQKKIEAIQEEQGARFVKGQIMLAKNFPTDQIPLNTLREFFGKYAPVGYIDVNKEAGEAQIRFNSEQEDIVRDILKKVEESGEKVVFMDKELELSILEGDEEAKYWADFNKAKALKKFENKKNRGKKRPYGGNNRFQNKRARTHKKFDDDGDEVGQEAEGSEEKTGDSEKPQPEVES
uniref:La protein n=1 Tax=Panagrolaimus sp. JU765 TaxID=591449 RepID=A0AC34QPQ7_9BILA